MSQLISQVAESEIYATARDLQAFVTRQAGWEENTLAGTYVHDRFAAIPGLRVAYQGGTVRNVIAILPGSYGTSDAVWMIGAHYDSISNPASPAPGATDNGCGVGVVIELARIMSKYHFRDSVAFASWNSEEQGAVGSTAYVAEMRQNGRNIKLYINFDSAGYDPYRRRILDIMSNRSLSWAADMMTQDNRRYQIGLSLTYNIHASGSDHWPFWTQGYAALSTHSEERGPAHTPADTVDKISLPYAKMNAQLGMTVIAELAGLQSAR